MLSTLNKYSFCLLLIVRLFIYRQTDLRKFKNASVTMESNRI